MKEYTLLKWVVYKLLTVFLVFVFLGLLYFVINFGELYQVLSLLRHKDIIVFDRGSIAAVGGIPMLIYILFFHCVRCSQKAWWHQKNRLCLGRF